MKKSIENTIASNYDNVLDYHNYKDNKRSVSKMKWSEILPQDALNLSVQLENYALEERSRGKVLFPE